MPFFFFFFLVRILCQELHFDLKAFKIFTCAIWLFQKRTTEKAECFSTNSAAKYIWKQTSTFSQHQIKEAKIFDLFVVPSEKDNIYIRTHTCQVSDLREIECFPYQDWFWPQVALQESMETLKYIWEKMPRGLSWGISICTIFSSI